MSDHDVIARLAKANPFHVTDLAPLDLPSLDRRPTRRRTILVAAMVVAAIAASLVGLFAIGGAGSHTRADGIQQGPTGPNGPPGPTIDRPLPAGKEVTLPEAAAVLDVPLVIPDTPLVGPGNVGPVWAWSGGEPRSGIVAVTYPAQGLYIDYQRPPEQSDPEAYFRAAAKAGPARLIDLDGTLGLAFTPSSDQPDAVASVEFAVAGTEYSILGHQDEATLETIARSILGREGAAPGTPGIVEPVHQPVNLPALSDAFGKPVVLPRTSLVQPSDATSAWTTGECSHFCNVQIWFPNDGLTVTYSRQGSSAESSRFDLERIARHVRFGDGDVIDLNGVPALVIENEDGPGLGELSFDWDGANIQIDGFENAAVLTDLAQSMLDQLGGTSSGPFTASPGVDFFPIVPPQNQVDVSDASTTLGAAVVLPDTTAVPSDAESAWGEGQCPHATASSTDGYSGCAVWVKFPAKSLTIVYERPGGSGAGLNDGQLGEMTGAHLVDLGGVPALAIDRNAQGPNPGWLEFAVGGTRVILSGDFDAATLQSIGQSIVDRSK